MSRKIIRPLAHSEVNKLGELIDVYEDVFEMKDFKKPPPEYLQKLLNNEQLIFFVAEDQDKVIGGLTANILPSVYFQSAEVYVYDLAVKREYQRQGVGSDIMKDLNDFCRKKGYQELFIQADVQDSHAIDFYNKIGGAPESVMHFSFTLQNKK